MASDGSPSPLEEWDDVSVGEALGRLRKTARITGQRLGELTGMSQPKISRIETGAVSVDPADVQKIAAALGLSPADQARLVERASSRSPERVTGWQPVQSDVVDRQLDFARIERETREFRIFQPTVVIGLLQTSEYARAILSRFQVGLLEGGRTDESVVFEAVAARVGRHEVLADSRRRFHFVLTETVLNNRVCRPSDMLAQIDRLREVSRQENVTMTVIPSEAPLSIPPYHGFEVLDEKYVLVDLYNTTVVTRERSDIAIYGQVFENLEEVGTTEIDQTLDRYFDLYLELTRQRAHAANE